MVQQKATDSWVVRIIIINVGVYIFQMLTRNITVNDPMLIKFSESFENIPVMTYFGALRPALVVAKGYIWQFVSYMFLHSTSSFLHIFFNMYILLICGIPIENIWGSKRFLFYYFFTGIGAGICIFLMNYFIGSPLSATLGASGAVFGILLAFGIMFPDVEFLVFFVLPMKAKHFVLVYGLVEVYLLFSSSGSNISHIGHVGGLLFGIVYFLILRKHTIQFKSKMLRAKIHKQMQQNDIMVAPEKENNVAFLQNIHTRIKSSGVDSLSDDEYQKLKYILIMDEDTAGLCDEEDFDLNDTHCVDCETTEKCLIRDIKKYM